MSDYVTVQLSTTVPSLSNWASAAIRRITRSRFSHADFVLANGALLGASDSPQSPILQGNARGVAIRPANYEEFAIRRRIIIKTSKADAIISAALSQLGKPFDSSALNEFLHDHLLGFRDWKDPDRWFCSELVAWSFDVGGHWVPDELLIPKDLIAPEDLILIFMFDQAWINRKTFWQPVEGITLGAHER